MAGILDRFKVNLPEEEEVDVSHRIRAGIIGVGWITEAHVTSLLRCPDNLPKTGRCSACAIS